MANKEEQNRLVINQLYPYPVVAKANSVVTPKTHHLFNALHAFDGASLFGLLNQPNEPGLPIRPLPYRDFWQRIYRIRPSWPFELAHNHVTAHLFARFLLLHQLPEGKIIELLVA
jgi:hypothetical protein